MKSSLRHSAGGPTLCNNICPCACVGACKHLIEPVQMHWREHCLSVIKYCSSYHLMVTSNASFNLQSKVYHVVDSLTRELLMASTLHISVSGDLEGARLEARRDASLDISTVSLKTWRCKKLSNSARDRMTKY